VDRQASQARANAELNQTDPSGLLTITGGLSFDVVLGAFTIGGALSFPDPITGGEFDIGLFVELGVDANTINKNPVPSSVRVSKGGGISAALQLGLRGGSVADLAGRGAEIGALAETPLGFAVGGAAQFNSSGFSGIELEVGAGFAAFARGTATATVSARRGFRGFNTGNSTPAPRSVPRPIRSNLLSNSSFSGRPSSGGK